MKCNQLSISFGYSQKLLQILYTSSKCIMMLHGHYLNGLFDVLELAWEQAVGGVLEESQCFKWKAVGLSKLLLTTQWSDLMTWVVIVLLLLKEVNK